MEMNIDRIIEMIEYANQSPTITEFVITGGEPTANLSLLKRIVDACKKRVYVNTTLPKKNLDAVIEYLDNEDKIFGINISRQFGKLNNLYKYVASPEDILKIRTSIRINVMRTKDWVENLDQFMDTWITKPNVLLNLREDYRYITKENLTVPLIDQFYYETREKFEGLCRVLDMEETGKLIIFCRTKRAVDDLTASLEARGYLAGGLHGDLSQVQRDRVMKKFRDGRIDTLVATDVAARGIDIDDITHVINYDIPQDHESYVHRIGRTGRAGRKGVAMTFISPREYRQLRLIMKQPTISYR